VLLLLLNLASSFSLPFIVESSLTVMDSSTRPTTMEVTTSQTTNQNILNTIKSSELNVGSNIGAIIGGLLVIGTLTSLVLIVSSGKAKLFILMCFCCFKQKKKKVDEDKQDNNTIQIYAIKNNRKVYKIDEIKDVEFVENIEIKF